MLIDDNPHDNFFHDRVIRLNNFSDTVIIKTNAKDALEYLKSNEFEKDKASIDLIFLDINMPGMNGWDFLEEYNLLNKDAQSRLMVVMLTTSENPEDYAQSKKWNFVTDYKTKPLTKEMMTEILNQHF